MKVSDYIPNLYKNNLEMNTIINVEEEELENGLKANIEDSFNDTFAIRATENGISNFEKIFDIKPNLYTDTLEFRRQRVINRLVSTIPYTEKFLIMKLNSMLGEGNWSYRINHVDYTLQIYSLIPGKNWYKELLDFLERIIPCNIDWTVTVYSATWSLIQNHFSNWNEIKTSNMTWQQLQDAEWL